MPNGFNSWNWPTNNVNVFAYCCASFKKSVQKAAGVAPLLSPPVNALTFSPDLLMGRDLVYFKLHGLPSQPFWYGDNWISALHTSAFHNVALKGTVIFVANCHFEESPFLEALLRTGATVIGSNGPNFAQAHGVIGADLVGLHLREAIARHLSPANALRQAKNIVARRTLQMHNAVKRKPERAAELEPRIAANEDALQFKIYT